MIYDLVLIGKGALFPVFIGALQEFEAQGHAARQFIASSTNAIIAALMAAGYSAAELHHLACEKLPDGRTRLASFIDMPEGFERNYIHNSLMHTIFSNQALPLVSRPSPENDEAASSEQIMQLDEYRIVKGLIETSGICTGNTLFEWITEKLHAKNPCFATATLKEFHAITQHNLILFAADTTVQNLLVLNHSTAPQCPVAWAIRMSAGIPFLWEEIRWNGEWGFYHGSDITGHAIVDGSVLSATVMINLAGTENKETLSAMDGDTDCAIPRLWLIIDEILPVANADHHTEIIARNSTDAALLVQMRKKKIIKTIQQLVNSTFPQQEKTARTFTGEQEICRLPAQGYGPADFDMSERRLHALIAAGRTAMRDFLQQR